MNEKKMHYRKRKKALCTAKVKKGRLTTDDGLVTCQFCQSLRKINQAKELKAGV